MIRNITVWGGLLFASLCLFGNAVFAQKITCASGQYADIFDHGKCKAMDSKGNPKHTPSTACVSSCVTTSTMAGGLLNLKKFNNCTAKCVSITTDKINGDGNSTSNNKNIDSGLLGAPASTCPTGTFNNPYYLDNDPETAQIRCNRIDDSGIPQHAPKAVCYANCFNSFSGLFNPITAGMCVSNCSNKNDTQGWTPDGNWEGRAPACDATCDSTEFAWCTAANLPGCAYSDVATPQESKFGEDCLSGRKAYCVKTKTYPRFKDIKGMNDPRWMSGWHGKAPFCAGECPDGSFAICRSRDGKSCDYQEGVQMKDVWGDFGWSCSTGRKVMCLKTNFLQND